MNYAAVLAVLLVLSFSFPLLLEWGEQAGLSRPSGVITFLVLCLLLLSWGMIRMSVHRHRLLLERVERIQTQIVTQPQDPQAYFDEGEHLGDLLLKLNRRRESVDSFERYARLEGAMDLERQKLQDQLERGYTPSEEQRVEVQRVEVQRSS